MPSQGIVQRMKQIARSVVPIVDSRTAHHDSCLLVLLYHPIVGHVVEELLHFEIRQSGDFCKADREDDLLGHGAMTIAFLSPSACWSVALRAYLRRLFLRMYSFLGSITRGSVVSSPTWT